MIDIENSWRIVKANAIKSKRLNVKFHSVRQHATYSFGNIDENTIEILVENAEPRPFGRLALQNQLQRINEQGGEISYHDFFDNVAKETAVVFLHPQLSWDIDGLNIIDLNRN